MSVRNRNQCKSRFRNIDEVLRIGRAHCASTVGTNEESSPLSVSIVAPSVWLKLSSKKTPRAKAQYLIEIWDLFDKFPDKELFHLPDRDERLFVTKHLEDMGNVGNYLLQTGAIPALVNILSYGRDMPTEHRHKDPRMIATKILTVLVCEEAELQLGSPNNRIIELLNAGAIPLILNLIRDSPVPGAGMAAVRLLLALLKKTNKSEYITDEPGGVKTIIDTMALEGELAEGFEDEGVLLRKEQRGTSMWGIRCINVMIYDVSTWDLMVNAGLIDRLLEVYGEPIDTFDDDRHWAFYQDKVEMVLARLATDPKHCTRIIKAGGMWTLIKYLDVMTRSYSPNAFLFGKTDWAVAAITVMYLTNKEAKGDFKRFDGIKVLVNEVKTIIAQVEMLVDDVTTPQDIPPDKLVLLERGLQSIDAIAFQFFWGMKRHGAWLVPVFAEYERVLLKMEAKQMKVKPFTEDYGPTALDVLRDSVEWGIMVENSVKLLATLNFFAEDADTDNSFMKWLIKYIDAFALGDKMSMDSLWHVKFKLLLDTERYKRQIPIFVESQYHSRPMALNQCFMYWYNVLPEFEAVYQTIKERGDVYDYLSDSYEVLVNSCKAQIKPNTEESLETRAKNLGNRLDSLLGLPPHLDEHSEQFGNQSSFLEPQPHWLERKRMSPKTLKTMLLNLDVLGAAASATKAPSLKAALLLIVRLHVELDNALNSEHWLSETDLKKLSYVKDWTLEMAVQAGFTFPEEVVSSTNWSNTFDTTDIIQKLKRWRSSKCKEPMEDDYLVWEFSNCTTDASEDALELISLNKRLVALNIDPLTNEQIEEAVRFQRWIAVASGICVTFSEIASGEGQDAKDANDVIDLATQLTARLAAPPGEDGQGGSILFEVQNRKFEITKRDMVDILRAEQQIEEEEMQELQKLEANNSSATGEKRSSLSTEEDDSQQPPKRRRRTSKDVRSSLVKFLGAERVSSMITANDLHFLVEMH